MAALPIPEVGFGQLRVVAPPRVRASDADRVATVQALQDAMAEGRLTFDECAERMEASYATRYVDDLPRLTADLPPRAAPPPPPPGWAELGRMALARIRSSLGSGLRSTRDRAGRWREAVRGRLAGGSGSRPTLRVVLVGLLVLAAVGAGLFVLALAGLGAHDLFGGGHGHGGGGYHHWDGYGHHHHHDYDYDYSDNHDYDYDDD
jgi:Domain of unknown function (DUF1707)